MQIRRRITLETEAPGKLFALVFLAIVVLDQSMKALIVATMSPGDSIPLIDGILHITYVRNVGAAFGLMPGQRILLLSTGMLVIAGISIFWWRKRPKATWLVISLAIIAGGSIGNFIDRASTGLVTDYVDVFGDLFPVFNVADSAIIIGVFMLMIWVMFGPDSGDKTSSDDAETAENPDGVPV